jgi:hypothetical protein
MNYESTLCYIVIKDLLVQLSMSYFAVVLHIIMNYECTLCYIVIKDLSCAIVYELLLKRYDFVFNLEFHYVMLDFIVAYIGHNSFMLLNT